MVKRSTKRPADASWGMPKPEWAKRRRVLYLALAFCAVWMSWVLYKGTDSVLYQTALYVFGGGAVTLVGTYVFGAVFDDKNYMTSVTQMRRRRRPDDEDDDHSPDDDEDDDHSPDDDEDDKDPPISGGR